MHPCRVLFICTGNSARSILSEATLNHLGKGRFEAFSAGSQPTGRVNPYALEELASAGISTENLSSKSWDRFVDEGAPPLDIVITVCDSAAKEPCPVLFGDFVRTHWGLSDPAAVQGNAIAISKAFQHAHALITYRLMALLNLPVESMTRDELQHALDHIGAMANDDDEEGIA
ncbi:arsenate reductase ArsC [Dyella acidisoli]|uniref:Protein-tyrosine-phosphatase n=1 Tax=Dyella acidisoli TaxID=1867834 RepID=A0ABQ5XN54_9GAMM|nr:arsenate reductase ArsC [Dyella acidisoli]GLQ91950.1 protein-tyrosine-phosphatase [Dyella acidisoli]